MRLPTVILLSLIVALCSCHPAENHTGLREWKLAPTASLTIGGGGAPETEFTGVMGAWRLANGAIAVVDAGSSELRLFDAGGAFAHAFGQRGDGPGEFRQIGWTGHSGDTAEVYDAGLGRITTILLDGAPRLLATLPVNPKDDRSVGVAGRLADGRWLVRSMSRPDVNARGVQRIPGFAGLMDSNAAGSVQWLAEGPDMSVFVYNVAADRKMVSVSMAPFPAWLVVTASGSVIWFGDAAADSLMRIDAVTGKKQTIKLPDRPAPVTREAIDAARTRELADTRDPAERTLIEAKYSATYLPAHLPALQALVPGTAGELWVQGHVADPAAPGRYVVLSASGSPVARVSVPAGFRITEAGHDYLVGVHRDDDGVETVRVYSLTR